ncbi:plasmid pRiA4b ORF-3 family protein [Natribacillus halophilus]|uniref:PRiA4b ORF-3-like protein n=1 Tax=Natribacillus halophilus TaxID=549003 RepID=A0A1G8KFC6_9BACI|nr:plasmid pRiA4b ORF-3 family protein [Natribacillus halophilus]SDI41590.1 pRiA4b ORF-3-like protein [Natribacillus halophilus]
MLIQCTQKLLNEVKRKPATDVEQEAPLFSWHANVITIKRKIAVVLVNDNNRYAVVLYGLRAKDFQKLDELIVRAIQQTFREEGMKDDVIEQYLHTAGSIIFTKTKNRKTVARLNKASENVQIFADLLHNHSLYQTDAGMRVSRLMVTDGNSGYIHPNKEMYRDLQAFVQEPVISCKAALLKVTLELGNFEVWRKIIVPVHMTFDQLHRVIQEAFYWQNSHLHEYYIFASDKEGLQPIVNLVPDEESLEFERDIPTKLEFGIKLSEYLPAMMKYLHDFGDDWVHKIEVEEMMDDFDKNYPVCLEAYGNAPPEDVGGEGGYEEFLNIMADEHHPDHTEMLRWGRFQGYKDVDIEKINWSFKNMV